VCDFVGGAACWHRCQSMCVCVKMYGWMGEDTGVGVDEWCMGELVSVCVCVCVCVFVFECISLLEGLGIGTGENCMCVYVCM
jgi:hypothetical protein